MPDLAFDDASGRFLDGAGRAVSDARVRAVVDQVADAASARMAAASEGLLAGRLSLGAWQVEMARVLKDAHLAAAVFAHGGAESMTFSHYGSAGRAIRDQYAFLRGFAADLQSGRQPLNRTVVSRSELYGQAARVTFESERARGQVARGFQSYRNVLNSGESCASCQAQSARGWVPIGSLVAVGSRSCLSRCRCTIEYRQEPADAEDLGLASPGRGGGSGGSGAGGQGPVRTTPIAAPTSRAIRAAERLEDTIRLDAKETAIIVNVRTGAEEFRVLGDEEKVVFSSQHIRDMKGHVVTHNHAGGVEGGPEALRGLSFSERDIETAALAQVAEERVVTAGWRYSLRPPPTGWNAEWWSRILVPEYGKARSAVLAELIPRMDRKDLTREEGDLLVIHETWVRVAKALGMRYTRTPVTP